MSTVAPAVTAARPAEAAAAHPRPARPVARVAARVRSFLASLRLQLLWWFVAILAAATIASVLLVRVVLLQRVDARIDAELRQEVEEIRRLAGGVDPATSEPFGDRVDRIFDVFLDRNIPAPAEALVTIVDGRLYRTTADAAVDAELGAIAGQWASLREVERGQVESSAGALDYLAVPFLVDGETRGVFVVAILSDALYADADAATIAAATVGFVMLVLGSLLASRLADRILRPVAEVTATARSISESDLTQRIDVRGHDEISGLAATFDDMLGRLEAAFSTQRRFIDEAGHELRTPITIIRGHLDVMGDDAADRTATLAIVGDELDRMSRLVDDLLTLARAERPDFIRRQPTNVARLTERILETARALDPGRSWGFESGADVVALVDGQRLTEAALQLAENAVRYAGPGVPVGIGSAVAGTRIELWVRDEGTGIPHEEQARVFDRFHRGGSSRRSEGSGLGLSIVRAIAEAHGGSVRVASAPGRGATFTISLPWVGAEGARP